MKKVSLERNFRRLTPDSLSFCLIPFSADVYFLITQLTIPHLFVIKVSGSIRRLFPSMGYRQGKQDGCGEHFTSVPAKPGEKALLLIRGPFSSDRAICPGTPSAGSWTEIDAIGFFPLLEPIFFFLTHLHSDTFFFRWFSIIDWSYNQELLSVGLANDAGQTFQNLRGGLLSQLMFTKSGVWEGFQLPWTVSKLTNLLFVLGN